MKKEYIYGIGGIIAFLIYFRRCPHRTPDGDGMISPCDGIVTGMEGQGALVYLSTLDVHCQRAPVTGTITSVTEDTMFFDDGTIVALRQGQLFRDYRLVIDVKAGQSVTRGEEISHIWFGSHVRITIPEGKKFLIEMGDIVWAGKTIIAE